MTEDSFDFLLVEAFSDADKDFELNYFKYLSHVRKVLARDWHIPSISVIYLLKFDVCG